MWEKEKAGIQQNMVSISTQFRRMKKKISLFLLDKHVPAMQNEAFL